MKEPRAIVKTVIHARKRHVCFLCGAEIQPKSDSHPGAPYVRYTDIEKIATGKPSVPICILCGCVMRRIATNGDCELTIKRNGWREPLLPNCIRKLKTALHRNPKEFVAETERLEAAAAERIKSKQLPSAPKVFYLLESPSADLSRRQFFTVPWRLKHFHDIKAGDVLRIRGGMNGETYVKTVKGTAVIGKRDAQEILKRGEKSLLIRAR